MKLLRLIKRSRRQSFTEGLAYQCNVCGAPSIWPELEILRDQPSCDRCLSSVRQRAIIHILSTEIYGQSYCVREFPKKRDLTVVGLSDWEPYADVLKLKMNYTNTFIHKKPLLDIARMPTEMENTVDFLISSDVFEHVVPPVSTTFSNAFRMLRPGGRLILTVPFTKEGEETKEHFPKLHRFKIIQKKGQYLLKNTREDGVEEEFRDLVFHGGPGDTLEMRVFSEKSILRELKKAGFKTLKIHHEPFLKYGIVWQQAWSLPIVATKS